MARSERYILPSEEQIRQWEREAETKRQFDVQRSILIDSALQKLRKSELIELLMGLDVFDPSVRWSLEAEINLQKPSDLIAHDLRHAIGIATRVDELSLNRNFDYSWQAYEEVKRGFNALLGAGDIATAKQIAIEFMQKASYQVECSDEGLMVEEIEACLKPVRQAVADCEHDERSHWAHQMLHADCCGFICREELESLLHPA